MGRSTTRKAILKRKKECNDCNNFIGTPCIGIIGECKKGLQVTCYRQHSYRNKCKCYEVNKDALEITAKQELFEELAEQMRRKNKRLLGR